MKNFLLFLSLFLMFLLGAGDVNGTLPVEEGVEVECVLQTDSSVEQILLSEINLPDEGEACVNTENLARQYRANGRGQRSFSVQQMFYGKSLAYRAARRRLEMLSHTINQTYTSMPCQSWSLSSDHYVFGMRRILI